MPDLVSPGVSVTVTDESFYAGAAQGTVPLFVVASASNKADPSTTNSTAAILVRSLFLLQPAESSLLAPSLSPSLSLLATI